MATKSKSAKDSVVLEKEVTEPKTTKVKGAKKSPSKSKKAKDDVVLTEGKITFLNTEKKTTKSKAVPVNTVEEMLAKVKDFRKSLTVKDYESVVKALSEFKVTGWKTTVKEGLVIFTKPKVGKIFAEVKPTKTGIRVSILPNEN